MKTSTIIAAAIGIFAAASLSADTPKADAAEAKADPKGVQAVTEIIIDTSMGTMKAELYPDKAPETVKNFLAYVDDSFYDGTIFHRVIKNFMIQGGGFTPDMKQKATRAPVRNEAKNGLKNDRGTLAMARTQVIDSATSQFFINHKDNDFLNFRAPNVRDFGYCVFGKVTEGLEVLDAIAGVKTGQVGFYGDVPVETVKIVSIRRAEPAGKE